MKRVSPFLCRARQAGQQRELEPQQAALAERVGGPVPPNLEPRRRRASHHCGECGLRGFSATRPVEIVPVLTSAALPATLPFALKKKQTKKNGESDEQPARVTSC